MKFLYPAKSLVSVSYETSGTPSDVTPPQLHPGVELCSLSVVIPLWCLTHLTDHPAYGACSRWDIVMRDLDHLATAKLEAVRIVLKDDVGVIAPQLPPAADGAAPAPETYVQQMERVATGMNWDALASFLERCKLAKHFIMEFQPLPPTGSSAEMERRVSEYRRCCEVLLEAMRPSFSRSESLKELLKVAVFINLHRLGV